MISKKGKRRMEYNGAVYYWFVRKNREGVPRIHILSEDKKVNLEFPLFDSEASTTRQEIERLLKQHIHPDAPWGPDDL
ncbi:hypothetical protein DWX10_21970 [Clostridium sp. AF18-27]|uniref:hypothetical protein n=1 Tax=Enterocloster lavalensis TaxID=460384 RepID=UPI000E473855|nr:hypothetical protein [Enterocloster lavalensis]RHR49404.1 hypothetical protein DWX10_21970 [Clostridium sp. AF18-27]